MRGRKVSIQTSGDQLALTNRGTSGLSAACNKPLLAFGSSSLSPQSPSYAKPTLSAAFCSVYIPAGTDRQVSGREDPASRARIASLFLRISTDGKARDIETRIDSEVDRYVWRT